MIWAAALGDTTLVLWSVGMGSTGAGALLVKLNGLTLPRQPIPADSRS
jgi:hypothetical protein